MNRLALIALFATLGLAACDKPAATSTAAKSEPSAPAVVPASVFLTAAPENPKEVKAAKADAKVGETVALHGRIGGSREPFVDGRAVFTLVDMELPPCNVDPNDTCKTPWDYCCETKSTLSASTATIQVVDSAGAPLKGGIKGAGNLKELDEIVVVGKVAQAEPGKLLVLNAEGIYRKAN